MLTLLRDVSMAPGASILIGTQAKLESMLKPLLPPEIVTLLSRCDAINARHRPESALAIAKAFRRFHP